MQTISNDDLLKFEWAIAATGTYPNFSVPGQAEPLDTPYVLSLVTDDSIVQFEKLAQPYDPTGKTPMSHLVRFASGRQFLFGPDFN